MLISNSVLPERFSERCALRHALNAVRSYHAVCLHSRCRLGLLGTNQIGPGFGLRSLRGRLRCLSCWCVLSSAALSRLFDRSSLCLLALLFSGRRCYLRFWQSTDIRDRNSGPCILACMLLARACGWLRRRCRRLRGCSGRRDLSEIALRRRLRCGRSLSCGCRSDGRSLRCKLFRLFVRRLFYRFLHLIRCVRERRKGDGVV